MVYFLPTEDFPPAGFVAVDLGRVVALPVRLLGLPAGFFATPEQVYVCLVTCKVVVLRP